ncbi:SNF2 family N-terminal domain-containing protein [Mycena olivaceomarginata]|nr:SNF2 family N-terminal domain-containing protein [Mycena olivaceomarginata]
MSSDDDSETPALVVKSSVEIGVLSSYHDAPKVYAWLKNEIYGIQIKATVASLTLSPEVSITLHLRICAPASMHELYMPRMLWALSDSVRDSYDENAPQEPPPLWQVACLRDHNLTTALAGETNWTEELDTLDIYTGIEAAVLPEYTGSVLTKTALYPHQSQALQWAIQQENPTMPTGQSVVQLWKYHQQKNTYVHTVLKTAKDRQQLARALGRGGLLADEMGLGKSLTMIALIRVTQGEPIRGYQNSTLIVAPLSVLSTWEEQISFHCPTLTYRKYHPAGDSTTESESDFKFDVVITNYDTLRREANPLSSISWRRVILDEAHHIRNPATQIHQAVLSLDAYSRWALTGTPIINSLHDVQSILGFLQTCQPMAMPQNWDQYIGSGKKPVNNGTVNLKKLLKCFCLHRTKEMRDADGRQILALPKVSYRTITIKLGSKQQDVYDQVATSGKKHLREAGGSGLNLLTIILRLRQVVLHPALVPAASRTQWGDTLTNESPTCIECLEAVTGESLRRCKMKHLICFKCAGISSCPCGSAFDSGTHTAEERGADSVLPPENGIQSAKLDALVVMLKQTSAADKCLVFSSFVKFLKIVESRLNDEGIPCLLYHGQISPDQRTANVDKFKTCSATDPGAPRVMLLSLAAGALGLNLTVANNVFLMDPWWQPSIERQAIDRVNRMGQTKEASKSAMIRAALSDTKSASSAGQVDFQAWTQTQAPEKRRMLLDAL